MALYINNLTHNSHSPAVDAPDVAHVSRRAVSAFLPTCLRPSRCTPKKTTKRTQARTPEPPCRHSGLHVFAPTSRNYQTNLRFTPPPVSAPLDIDVDPPLHPKTSTGKLPNEPRLATPNTLYLKLYQQPSTQSGARRYLRLLTGTARPFGRSGPARVGPSGLGIGDLPPHICLCLA